MAEGFKALNIPIDESTLDELVHVDDENSEEFSNEIVDDVNKVLKSIQATNDNEDENIHTVVETCAHSPEPIENEVTFCRFEHIYNKVLEIEDRLLCSDVQAQAQNYYNELRNSFELSTKIKAVYFGRKTQKRAKYVLTDDS